MSDDLVRRLRGQYAMGPHTPNGEPEFGWRQFEAPPIQYEAADEIERLRAENARLRELESEQTKYRARHWLRRKLEAPEDVEVADLCEQHGYGAVMDAASRLWARKPHGSGAFYIGGCIGRWTDEEARAALQNEGGELEGEGFQDASGKEYDALTKAGIVEVTVRKPSVMEYMQHWEARAEKAEAENARLMAALLDATAYLSAAASAYQHYAKRHRSLGVPPADALFSTRSKDFEDAAKRARTALQTEGGE